MKKKFFFFLFFHIFLLAGCTKNYDQNSVMDYVQEQLSLSEFTVSQTYKEIKGEDGYTDRLWTVKDKEHNITFHVLDDYFWGMESVSNHLSDDYEASLFASLYQKLEQKDNLSFIKENKDSLFTVQLVCNYKNKEELTDCYDSVLSYKKQIDQFGYQLNIPYSVEYDFEFKNIGDYQIKTGDQSGSLKDIDENVYQEMIYNYYSTALTYQIEDSLLEMTPSDKDFVMNHEDTHRIFKRTNQGSLEFYDDVIGNENSYGISFGGLYKILKQENFPVVGNAWHYTVTVNSDIYEFSYDFNDLLYEDEDQNFYGYYYKKNGQKMKMNFYFYNCFKPKEINEMFGLNIEESTNKAIK